jgi:hypothetical protein
MTKSDIKQRLNDVLDFADEGDPIGYLEYDVRAIERFIRTKTRDKKFRLIKARCESSWQVPDVRGNVATVYFPTTNDVFYNRAILAVGLAFVLNTCVRPYAFLAIEGFRQYISKVSYFAQYLLRERERLFSTEIPCPRFTACTDTGNCCSRGGYASPSDEVPTEEKLKSVIGGYEPNEPDSLQESEKASISSLIDEIHSGTNDKGFLDYTVRLVESFIKDTWKRDYIIVKTPIPGKSRAIVNSSSYAIKDVKYAVTTAYPKGWNIQYSNTITCCPLEQRVLLAHELGDIACHWTPERQLEDKETTDERRNSTYFARLLLEHRASFYFKDPVEFKEAKKKIKQAIRRLYRDMTWLDEIFTEKEWGMQKSTSKGC